MGWTPTRLSDFSPEYQDIIERCIKQLKINPELVSYEQESGDILVLVYRGVARFEVVIARTVESGSIGFDENFE